MARRTDKKHPGSGPGARMQEYLWPGTDPPHDERWNVGVRRDDGYWQWIGVVRSEKPERLGDIHGILADEMRQLSSVMPQRPRCFAVLLPPDEEVEGGIAMISAYWPLVGGMGYLTESMIPMSELYRYIHGPKSQKERR